MITFQTARGSKIEIATETACGNQLVTVAINGKPTHDTFSLQSVDGHGECLRGSLQTAAGITTIPVPADKLADVRAMLADAKAHNAARAEKARSFDRAINEGGYGYNPYIDGSLS